MKKTQDEVFKFENSYCNLSSIFFTRQNPSKVPEPKLVILNNKVADELGLNINILNSNYGLEILSGNKLNKDSIPIAQAYAGHQFGYFTMLGDGRAVLLGEHITPKRLKVDVQLKGAGITPYSRGGDGKAALGPMLREYIISEAMSGLGIPTTKSLAVVETGEKIEREEVLKGAILIRIASSHIRVGNFQYISKWGNAEELKELADYTIKRHYPYIYDKHDKYHLLLKEVINKQAYLIARWQLVGFIHGVMNTDNMTISGETIDYGPCAFMDIYDENTVFSSIDTGGRYAYGNQPAIGQWNLARFSESLLPLLNKDKEIAINIAKDEVANYAKLFNEYWLSGMRKKLGIFNKEEDDEKLIDLLLSIMKNNKVDFTNTFYALTSGRQEYNKMADSKEFKDWYDLWQARLSRQKEDKELSINLMKKNNPVIIPRNYSVEKVLELATKKDDLKSMYKLLDALSNPYDYSKNLDEFLKVSQKVNKCYKTFCGT